LQAVGLTDAQKEQIRTIHEANREQAQQLGQRIGAAQKALDEAALNNASESDIRAKASDLATAIADGAVHRAKVNAEILNLLTAEQKQKLDEFRNTMQQRREQRRGAVEERLQNRLQRRGQ
jgi:Spy/CpxP family protein refolding chaperone